MTLDSLETAMFGYKKSSVFRYVTETEQAFSARLLAQEQDAHQKEAQLQARIQQLEEECDALRRQLAEQQENRIRLSGLLADAERLVEKVQTESVSREQEIRRMLDEEQAVRQQAFAPYLAQLRSVCMPQPGTDAAMPEEKAEIIMEGAAESEASEQKDKVPCVQSEASAVEQEGTARELEKTPSDETAASTKDGARSVRVGSTAEGYQMDAERNMSLFQRRVYPAD